MVYNILGDTPKQQWLNAIDLYSMVIETNIASVRHGLDEGCEMPNIGCEACEMLYSASSALEAFKDEMKRLVEAVFDE